MQAIVEYKNVFTPSQWSIVDMITNYSDRDGHLRSFSDSDVTECARKYGVSPSREMVEPLVGYLNVRTDALNAHVPGYLRSKQQARDDYECLRHSIRPQHVPIRSRRGKKEIAYMASAVNAIAEKTLKFHFDIEPSFRAVCFHDSVIAASCDRPDGVVPSHVNPRLIWETKEYFTGSNYGSRINDSVRVAETNGVRFAALLPAQRPSSILLLDGVQIWEKGRPHCCRLFDLLHKGLVDHVIFGRELLHAWEPILRTVAAPI